MLLYFANIIFILLFIYSLEINLLPPSSLPFALLFHCALQPGFWGRLHYMPHIFAFSIYRFSIFSFFFWFVLPASASPSFSLLLSFCRLCCCCFVACRRCRLEYISSILLKLWKWMKYLSAAVHSTCPHCPPRCPALAARGLRHLLNERIYRKLQQACPHFPSPSPSARQLLVHQLSACNASPVASWVIRFADANSIAAPSVTCGSHRTIEPSNCCLQISIPFRFRLSTAIRFSLCGSPLLLLLFLLLLI